MSEQHQSQPEKVLESWKEIAAYIQRDAKTAHRWETEEGLPVHRHTHTSRSSVYAFPSEIDAWRAGRREAPAPTPVTHKFRPLALPATLVLALMTAPSGIRNAAAQSPITRTPCTDCKGMTAYWPDADLKVSIKNELGHDYDWERLSPDKRQVAYIDVTRQSVEIRVVENRKDPGTPRTLTRDGYYEVIGWSRDSTALYVIGGKETEQIVRIAVADGTLKVLKELQWRLRGRNVKSWGRLSPDGKFIAYGAREKNPAVAQPKDDRVEQHIYVLAVDGSGEWDVVNTTAVNEVPEWTPDGKHLVYVSDVSGKRDLWAVPVATGKPAGQPRRLVTDIGDIQPIGFNKSGKFLYETAGQGVEYITLSRIPSSSGPVTTFVGTGPALSPDGKSIAFKRHRPGYQPQASDVVVRSLETGEERAYLSTLGFTGTGSSTWFHDRKALITGFNGTFHRLNLDTGEWSALELGPTVDNTLTSDDRTLYFRRGQAVVAVDLTSGRDRTVYTLPAENLQVFAKLSPDEKELAVRWFDDANTAHIVRVGVDGRNPQQVLAAPNQPRMAIAWTKSGIVFSEQTPSGKVRLMRIPPDGGTPVPIGVEADSAMSHPQFSPDGSQVAFSSVSGGDEVWMLSNILAALK